VEQSTVHINFTSPVVKLRFHLPGEVLLKDVPVNAYDSINGAQQYTIDLTLFNVSDALLTGKGAESIQSILANSIWVLKGIGTWRYSTKLAI